MLIPQLPMFRRNGIRSRLRSRSVSGAKGIMVAPRQLLAGGPRNRAETREAYDSVQACSRCATGTASENVEMVKGGLEVKPSTELPPKLNQIAIIHFNMDAAPGAYQVVMSNLGDPLVGCRYIAQAGSRDQTLFSQGFQPSVDTDQADAGVDRQHMVMNLFGREMSLEALSDVNEE